MAKQLYIISTATNDMEFPIYGERAPGRAPQVKGSIRIHGKAGLPNKHLWTPRGVPTAVTDEQLEELRKHRVFQKAEENGWFTVSNTAPRDADQVASGMAERDGSAQLNEAELAKKATAAKRKSGD